MCIKVRNAENMQTQQAMGSVGGRTPMWGGATPFGGATPMIGGATPNRAGGATPGHATPMHSGAGGATPLHEGQTPLHESVWKPETPYRAGGATPSHESNAGGGWGDDLGGNGGNEWGGGSMQGSMQPKDEDGGFGGSMMPPPARDESGWGGGAAAAADEPKPEEVQWRMRSVKVTYDGKPAAISSADGDSIEIVMLNGEGEPDYGQRKTVSAADIERVTPEKDSTVIVVGGADLVGQTGTLYGIDGDDGIVQLTDDIQILLLTRLAECVELVSEVDE